MFDEALENINWIADPIKQVVKVEKTKKEPFFQRSPIVKASRSLEGMTLHQIELFNFDELSFPHVNKYIAGLPDYLTKYFVKRYIRTFKEKSRRDANSWIREIMDKGILARVNGVMNIYPASKLINKDAGVIYASREAIAEWRLQKRKNAQYIKQMALVNEDDEDEIIGLDEMFYKTVSNPAVRRAELMVRMRGFEEVAKHLDYAGEFYTLTAPSSYHAVHSQGGFVKNWNFSSPADTQKYLCAVFAKIRASLKRQGINPFGFRVVEPHHDGTPHWHLLLFVEKDKVNAMRATFKRYALEEDGDEKGANEHRFIAKEIDWEKGSATGYIAKYIAKNIDGYACDDDVDLETGEKLKDMSRNVSAWARKWRIRQFQQIGGSPVTVWRELRRKRGGEVAGDEQLTKLVEAADRGDWAEYTLLQGDGMPTVKRTDLIARTSYEDREPNKYGEISKKIIGFFNQKTIEIKTILTRTTVWKLMKKAVVEGALKNSGRRPPWSSVNNCTKREISADDFSLDYQQSQLEKGELLTAIAKRKTWLEKNNIVLTPQDQMILLIGGKVRLKTDELLMFKNGALIKTGVTKWGA